MATKEDHKHTKKHFKSEARKKTLREDFDKKEKAARHHATPKQEREVKKATKKIHQEEERQSRRLTRHMGLS